MAQDHDTKTAAPDHAGLDNDGLGLADFLPDTSYGYIAKAGAALENPGGQADPVAVEDALKSVHDPEIPVNIYDLGLIYGVDIHEGHVAVTMTLTTPHCPVAESMPGEVEMQVCSVPGIADAEVNLVWDPPWDMEKMSEDAKLALGMY